MTVRFPPDWAGSARTILESYPGHRRQLEELFRWPLRGSVTVVLVATSRQFHAAIEPEQVLAAAFPARRLIVVDYARVGREPLLLQGTLHHELCHLLLHEHIGEKDLPRWLDEGVCQWASDGLSELVAPGQYGTWKRVAGRGVLLPLERLDKRFPSDRAGLQLAYAESKDFVHFLVIRYGRDNLIGALHRLARGAAPDQAFAAVYGASLVQLEKSWTDQLREVPRFLLLFMNHLYEVLFFGAAVIAVIGYLKLKRRKAAYDGDAQDDSAGNDA